MVPTVGGDFESDRERDSDCDRESESSSSSQESSDDELSPRYGRSPAVVPFVELTPRAFCAAAAAVDVASSVCVIAVEVVGEPEEKQSDGREAGARNI